MLGNEFYVGTYKVKKMVSSLLQIIIVVAANLVCLLLFVWFKGWLDLEDE